MSIYISGLEFPKVPTVIILLPDGKVEIPSQARMEKAMPVPEHGRMIDADAFCEKILEIVERQKYDDFYAESLSVGAILREVVNELNGSGLAGFSNAPTIIPASKEG